VLGPDLLVAPVLHFGARTRKVYLPEGAAWREAWLERNFDGGNWVDVDAPLERIPVFIRGDARNPLQA